MKLGPVVLHTDAAVVPRDGALNVRLYQDYKTLLPLLFQIYFDCSSYLYQVIPCVQYPENGRLGVGGQGLVEDGPAELRVGLDVAHHVGDDEVVLAEEHVGRVLPDVLVLTQPEEVL